MAYLPHTEEDVKEMLEVIGVRDIRDLFSPIPEGCLLKEPLSIPEGLSEQELFSLMEGLSRDNDVDHISFLGGGIYRHYIPKGVEHILLRSEFYTSYTPYQPEVSQGTLQAIFEYQTLICQLTGMEVANASMYDGASALAEAILMAQRINGRKKVVLSSALHPEYREVVRTYLLDRAEIREVLYCTETGRTLPESIEGLVDEDTCALVVQHPNFFGSLEDLKGLGEVIHGKGGLFIVAVAEPLCLAILKPPGEFGADIVVGEGQSFGLPPYLGGNTLGFFASRLSYLRQMPGRIVGETVDVHGERAFVLTLATREQHIRRERSTSNICTNANLSALAATVYLCLLGKEGLRQLASINLKMAHLARERLSSIKGFRSAFTAPVFNEFVLHTEKDVDGLLKALKEKGILGGIPLGRFYRELRGSILVSVTEMNTEEEIEKLAQEMEAYG